MKTSERDLLLKNLSYITAIYHYNSERRLMIQDFFVSVINNGSIFKKILKCEDIKKFCRNSYPDVSRPKTTNKKFLKDYTSLKIGEFEKSFEWTLMNSLYTDIPMNIFMTYYSNRYAIEDISKPFSDKFNFSPTDVYIIENVLMTNILKELEGRGCNQVNTIKNRKDYVSPDFIVEPPFGQFTNIPSIMTVNRSYLLELVKSVVSKTFGLSLMFSGVPYGNEEMARLESDEQLTHQLSKALDSISIDIEKIYENNEKINRGTIIRYPLLSIDNNFIYVPFYTHLSISTNIRLENMIEQNKALLDNQDKIKGKIVEEIIPPIFNNFRTTNLLRNLQYIDETNKRRYETDGLVIFDNSIWSIEVKTHPIFRKSLNERFENLRDIYIEKVIEGYEQGSRLLDYLSKNKQILELLSSKNKALAGVIVVIDGFVPTLFSQNDIIDSMNGTTEIYTKISKYRLSVFNLIDIMTFSLQENSSSIESFLKWRTDYLTNFPLVSMNEREIWDFKSTHIDSGNVPMKDFKKFADNKNIFVYIGGRFNKKDYIDKDFK